MPPLSGLSHDDLAAVLTCIRRARGKTGDLITPGRHCHSVPGAADSHGETGLLGDDRRRSRHCDGLDGTPREVGLHVSSGAYRIQPSILKFRSTSFRSGAPESGRNQTSNRAP